ncbi:glycosyltransferase family 2 protein [Subtercola boreus]|uniref:Glycosyltransferase n=1 Tax=Subtercola boreus TaxID=120213 RepID=A0A3E0WD11_9MICO|nr:glycosyltransferase family 2 protein [Subtercola boreus]RFA21191.1 hypothetical protein B7R24_07320 [Subtercola boreus]RFA21574.1 hypothetical protein B7R23_07265 [Subtercola boreus]RFA27544.1 hypothetical protein B7R25_07390 [Subtercola boreus]
MTAPTFSQLAIVVVNYGSTALLEANLAPLTRRQPDLTVVIVDNYSTDTERARLVATAAREGWHTVLPTGNTGFGGGMNRGVLQAEQLGAQLLLLLNPDVEIAEAALRLLLETSAEHPEALLSPQILRPDGSVWFNGSDLYLTDGRIRSARRRVATNTMAIEPWLSGACLLMTRELWRKTGGFDEQYFLYWEDVDFSHRVASAGGTLRVVSDAVAVHAEGGTQQGGGYSHSGEAKSNTYYYYNVRNRLLFAVRHLDDTDLVRWTALTRAIAWEILLQGGRRQFTRSLSPLVAAYRGARDGRRMVKDELRARRRRARALGRDIVTR